MASFKRIRTEIQLSKRQKEILALKSQEFEVPMVYLIRQAIDAMFPSKPATNSHSSYLGPRREKTHASEGDSL